MQNSKNPLRIYFKIAIFLLFCFIVNMCMKYTRGKGLFESNWEVVHKFVTIAGLGIFIYFYHYKSIVAWYVILITFIFLLPLLFLIPLPENSKISSAKLLFILTIFWILVCSDLLIRYKPYKKHLEEFKEQGV